MKEMRKVFIFLLVVGVLVLGTCAIIEDTSEGCSYEKPVDCTGELGEYFDFGDSTLSGDGHGGDGGGPIPG